jgi:hypothetical protein
MRRQLLGGGGGGGGKKVIKRPRGQSKRGSFVAAAAVYEKRLR